MTREHPRQHAGRVAQIGIDYADDRRTRGGKAFDHRRAESQLAGAMQHRDSMPQRQLVGQRPGAVRRVVVDDDDLAVDARGGIRREDPFDEILRRSRSLYIGTTIASAAGGTSRGGQGWNSQAL